ncbi:NmrA family NAD(P)-binding protein [Dactylosporangium sp. CA-139114]|uniref:NmrA family NAD(P)-binding protein n=1 Tax=Dactylosporangium sp. CA-139114 TaxID=3239931 RepID=UPI003D955F8F
MPAESAPMENFLLSAAYLLPRGAEGGIVTVLRPSTRLSLVAVDDIGATVAAAVAQPQRFHEIELELASDHLAMTEIAGILSRALGVPLAAPDMTEPEALAAGMPAYAGLPMELMNVAGQPARPRFARALGIPPCAPATPRSPAARRSRTAADPALRRCPRAPVGARHPVAVGLVYEKTIMSSIGMPCSDSGGWM